MDFSEFINKKALDTGKLFSSVLKKKDDSDFLPNQHCEFVCNIENRKKIECNVTCDTRSLVSLALINPESEALKAYANKSPIMCINVCRLMYTREAFELRHLQSDDISEDALQFYFKTDVQQLDMKLQPNARFSNLLHQLRKSGYEKYIFALAKNLDMNVDLIYHPNVVFRYINKINLQNNLSIGTLTAIKDGSKWFVKSTKTPLIIVDSK